MSTKSSSSDGIKKMDISIVKLVPRTERKVAKKYRQRIEASLRAVGLIEPLIVYRIGHKRLPSSHRQGASDRCYFQTMHSRPVILNSLQNYTPTYSLPGKRIPTGPPSAIDTLDLQTSPPASPTASCKIRQRPPTKPLQPGDWNGFLYSRYLGSN
jgi:hypothetical protein